MAVEQVLFRDHISRREKLENGRREKEGIEPGGAFAGAREMDIVNLGGESPELNPT